MKHFVIVADTFPPLRTSGAIQLKDLTLEFVKQGYEITVLIPDSNIEFRWNIDKWNGVNIVRFKSFKTKDVGYIRRTVSEFLMSFIMLYNLRKSPIMDSQWDGVIWYSPTIFFGPLVKVIKKSSSCKGYLILRDIFPEWAVDIGLMSKGIPYYFFKYIEKYQYKFADTIGVQSPANLNYMYQYKSKDQYIEVLHNWLGNVKNTGCSISISDSKVVDRKIFVYAGNMGVAQGIDVLIKLAESLINRKDIGFAFVGRGSDSKHLKEKCKILKLDNVVFFDEIPHHEIPGLYAQCHVGLIALDIRHRTHNIPGKFLSYMQNGLPVLASINPGNDLIDIINSNDIGEVNINLSITDLRLKAEKIIDGLDKDPFIKGRCHKLMKTLFMPRIAVNQIVKSL